MTDRYTIKSKGVKSILQGLVKLGLICMYESEDKEYYSAKLKRRMKNE